MGDTDRNRLLPTREKALPSAFLLQLRGRTSRGRRAGAGVNQARGQGLPRAGTEGAAQRSRWVAAAEGGSRPPDSGRLGLKVFFAVFLHFLSQSL